MGLTLNETFLAVFCALAILSIIATGAGQWVASRTMDTVRLTRLAIVNSRVRSFQMSSRSTIPDATSLSGL